MSQINESSKNGHRNLTLDFLRGGVMLIVVYAHALQQCNDMDPGNPLHVFIRLFQMKAMFLISGYALAYSKRVEFWPRVKSSLLRLGIPYLTWVITMWFVISIANGYGFSLSSLGGNILSSQFWFLRVLLEIMLVFYMCDFAAKGKDWVSVPLSLVVIYGLHYIPIFGLIWGMSRYFLLGYVLHKAVLINLPEPAFLKSRISCVVSWFGVQSLALYAVHWNLLFAYFPYESLDSREWHAARQIFIYGC